MVMRSLVERFTASATPHYLQEKKDDFGNALQNLYKELERAETLVGPAS